MKQHYSSPSKKPKIRLPQEIRMARQAGRLAAQVLKMIEPHVRPGISTLTLDKICHDYIVHELHAIPANIGYLGYGYATCISVNDVICHGIPNSTPLQEGDIVNIDVAVIKNGWYGDTSRMYAVGKIDPLAQRLITTTFDAMMAGIWQVRPGNTLGDIGHAIESIANQAGFHIVKEFCGHGIGTIYHDEPQVLNFGEPRKGLILKEGMIFTIEPMINAGSSEAVLLEDHWTAVTKDHALSAQWEHTVAVTADGYEILTPYPKTSQPQ